MLSQLGAAQDAIGIQRVEIGPGQYEGPERIALRFRFNGREVHVPLPNDEFFTDRDINSDARSAFEHAFQDVKALLPTDWLTKPR